ncbi:MAG: ATP-binding protein [Proteobacteria bacterium]|nr:ATP-binding protein [Pseudomonadota bacterium]
MTHPSRVLEARTLWAHALLACELARGRERGYFSGTSSAEPVDPDALRARITTELDLTGTPMAMLAARFELDAVEEDTLWLTACCESEPTLARFVEVIASTGMQQLSVQHVQRLVGCSSSSIDRLAGLGLLVIETDDRLPLHRRKIRIADRVLQLLHGEVGEDPRLAGIATFVAATATEAPPNLRAALARGDEVLALGIGPEGGDRELVLAAASNERVLAVQCARLATDVEQRRHELRAIVREARHAGAHLLFAGADLLLDDELFARVVLANIRGPILATARAPSIRSIADRPLIVHVLPPADLEARRRMWRTELVVAPQEVIEACADRYRIPTTLLSEIARSAAVEGTALTSVEAVQRLLRDRLDRRLAGFAKRVEWKQTWGDLVLPEDQLDHLRELVARVRHRRRVLDTWGFGAKVGKGTGTTALFSGPPGTGKTMIAGLLAHELGLDLYQVDLSKVVSKYIGETEQRLAELFDAAEHGQAVILFDEADSLFGKRTEVKSSNDRYANLETNYLLQRLESFEGICILTTNHEAAIDGAFLRRLSLHVRVPMPDEEHREKLWSALVPVAAEVADDVTFAELARAFVMSGGYIKNAVLRAAYLAAAEETTMANTHFWRAARAEYEGMGKVAFHRA